MGPAICYGMGGDLMAALCDIQTAFDTQISVFLGPSFTSLICMGGNNDSENKNVALPVNLPVFYDSVVLLDFLSQYFCIWTICPR
jgi:hypothetical protein